MFDAGGKDGCRHLVSTETSLAKKPDSKGGVWRGEVKKNLSKQLRKRNVNGRGGDS